MVRRPRRIHPPRRPLHFHLRPLALHPPPRQTSTLIDELQKWYSLIACRPQEKRKYSASGHPSCSLLDSVTQRFQLCFSTGLTDGCLCVGGQRQRDPVGLPAKCITESKVSRRNRIGIEIYSNELEAYIESLFMEIRPCAKRIV